MLFEKMVGYARIFKSCFTCIPETNKASNTIFGEETGIDIRKRNRWKKQKHQHVGYTTSPVSNGNDVLSKAIKDIYDCK